jgi:cytochrome c peroxidase
MRRFCRSFKGIGERVKRKVTGQAFVLMGALAFVGGACSGDDLPGSEVFTEAEWAKIKALGPLPALPPDPTNRWADSEDAARLGQRLFFENSYGAAIEVDGPSGRIGETGKVACVTCHDTGHYWIDTRSPANVSHGVNWTMRNAPSLVNVAFYKWYSWAGKQDSLWMQGANGNESVDNFHGTRLAYAHMIWSKYRDDYNALFPALDPALDPGATDAARFPPRGKPKTPEMPDGPWEQMREEDRHVVNTILANCGKALAAYERKLISRGSPFEEFVLNHGAHGLTPSARRGLKLFIGPAACDACHTGPTFTDDDFHVTGVEQAKGEHVPPMDGGRWDDLPRLLSNTFNGAGAFSDDPAAGAAKLAPAMAAKGDESQRGKFRTKTLLQVGQTGPYMHNGSKATLEEVVHFYNVGGDAAGTFAGAKDPRIVPLHLSEADEKDLVEFLKSLTGQPPPAALGQDTSAK